MGTVIRLELEQELRDSRRRLLEARLKRVRPGKDDKVLVSWNALDDPHALARAAGVLRRARITWLPPNVLLISCSPSCVVRIGRLLHCWRHGQAKLDAYLDDYAYLANALVTLYETDFDERWIDEAAELCDIMLAHFRDPEEGGFYFTADDHEALVARTKEWFDASVPSSNAMAATALSRLGKLTGSN